MFRVSCRLTRNNIYIYIHITEQFLQSNDPACKSYTTTRASLLQSYPTHLCMSRSDLQFRGEEEGHRSCIFLAGLYVSTKGPMIQRRVVTAKEEERPRPIQWKVTDDSEARDNCEGGGEAAADAMKSYR